MTDPDSPPAATAGASAEEPARVHRSSLRPLFTRDFLRYLGPGFIITVGFIDPGNWATNIAGGSSFAYQLLWVIGLSTLMLILFQNMSARIGIVTGHSLAYNVRRRFSRPWVALFGVTIVIACIATDIAEILGGGLGFQLLFGLPLPVGAAITVLLKMGLVLAGRYHQIERLIVVFLGIIAFCYLAELVIVRPDWAAAARGAVVPHLNGASILVAMGMLGAVVMPHNLYLHSNVILSREWPGDDAERRRLMTFEFGDTTLAMGLGWLVNSAMIVVAAAVFARHGIEVTSIEQASATLEPLAGNLARLLFGIALLLAGLGSSITSSMAEANVLTGYLGRPEDPRSRFYRIALFALSIPALAVIVAQFDSYRVLILSQVALSVQLPFTVLPLVLIATDRRVMGEFASGRIERVLAVAAGIFVVGLNALLLYRIAGGSF